MDNKIRLVEVEVVACLMAAAIVAFALMVGQALWIRLAHEYKKNIYPHVDG
jgi:hypothetical protein